MTKTSKTIIILIASLLINQANILAQEGILPYLYVESKDGNVVEIAFTNATMTVIDNLILVNTPEENHEFDYSDTEKFYFTGKDSLTVSNYSDFEVNLSPNPTTGKFRIEATNGFNEIKSISISNVQGQKMATKAFSGDNTVFDIKDYPAGVYFLKIELKTGETVTKKLLKH